MINAYNEKNKNKLTERAGFVRQEFYRQVVGDGSTGVNRGAIGTTILSSADECMRHDRERCCKIKELSKRRS